MKTARVVNRTRDEDLAGRARVADSRWTRLRGLLGRPRLRPGEGLVIEPSRGVHTWGMGYPIDVVLVGRDGRVTAVYPGLDPWSRTRVHREAARAVELPEGVVEATGTRPGDRVEVVPRAAAEEGEPVADGGGAGRRDADAPKPRDPGRERPPEGSAA